MDIFTIYFFVGGLICAGVGGYIAGEKNRSVGSWAIICFLLGIFGIIAIAAVPALPQIEDDVEKDPIKQAFPYANVHFSKQIQQDIREDGISLAEGIDLLIGKLDDKLDEVFLLGDTSFLVVDFERKQIITGLQETQKNPHRQSYRKSFAFSDIVKAEIVRDKTQIVAINGEKHNLNGASHIAIRVTVDDTDNPTHDVTFYTSKNTKERKFEHPPFEQAVQKIIEFQGYLETAIRESAKGTDVSDTQEDKEQSKQIEDSQNMPVSAQIAQLWQLKQEGALTQEEFEAQKAKLLQS